MPSATEHYKYPLSNEEVGIREVWSFNLKEAFKELRRVVHKYNYVALDTEFPGVVVRPIGEVWNLKEYQYQYLKSNVDLLRIIQLGLTFFDENGQPAEGTYSTWQFNFKFNLAEDIYAQESIDLLYKSGIQFQKHEDVGIDPLDFAELLMSSGVVLMSDVKWISFHGGFDFGYVIKLLTNQSLPEVETEFYELQNLYFPIVYDIKFLIKNCQTLIGGLQEISDQLGLTRIGSQHQAGSDSYLTGMAFFKIRDIFFKDGIDDVKYCGKLYGLGGSIVDGRDNCDS